jgi:hypothetical protein
MDAGTQTGIANQLLGMRETGNIADGGQDRHGQQDTKTRELHDEGGLICPWSLSTEAGDFSIEFGDLRGKMVQSGQILADAEFLSS